jgi:hypothetical protein
MFIIWCIFYRQTERLVSTLMNGGKGGKPKFLKDINCNYSKVPDL